MPYDKAVEQRVKQNFDGTKGDSFMMKRKLAWLLAGLMTVTMLAGCSKDGGDKGSDNNGGTDPGTSQGDNNGSGAPENNGFDKNQAITVITREEGSGTRGAFVELTGVEEKDADGNKVDNTTDEAVVANQTEAVITQVKGDPAAIGYISLVDGTEATAENVKNGSYKVSRPFNIATKGEASGLAKDFIDFILSKEGQEVVSGGYIPVNDAAAPFAGTKPEGKIVVGGSSSVMPIMEKLQEAYLKVNPNATIELQQSDSTAGMTGAKDGTYDIGMASRELKDSELADLTPTQIALDGIAVIVNQANDLSDISTDAIKAIYTGDTTTWAEVK